jgi:hypothetical protein
MEQLELISSIHDLVNYCGRNIVVQKWSAILIFNVLSGYENTVCHGVEGRTLAQVVSCWLVTMVRPGMISGQVMWDLWRTKWHWICFLQVLQFPL